jgi:hypothetical protein
MAAENGKLEFVQWLLEKDSVKLASHDKDSEGKSPADLARDKKHLDIAELLDPKAKGCCVIS